MSEQSLFRKKRVCACCQAESTERDRSPGRPSIIAVSFTMYRRGAGKKQLRGVGRVQICESCFVLAMAAGGLFEGREARKFIAEVRSRLSAGYTLMLEEDLTPSEEKKPDSPGLFEGAA